MTAKPAAMHLHDCTFNDLRALLERNGVNPAHTLPLWRSLHRLPPSEDGSPERRDWPPPLKRWWHEHHPASIRETELTLIRSLSSAAGDARKLLFRLADGHEIETVLMGYPGRHTACISTQVGCAMGCIFCATGQAGFVRHLHPGEIVRQVLEAQHLAWGGNRDARLRNLVLMGMGEPLHNYDPVMKALDIVCHQRGIALGPGRVTISTVGVVPGIRRLADERRPYRLAVSLHATTDEERSALVPVNRRWPLADILDACRHYAHRTGRRILFGWTLIEGRNDSPHHAANVAALLSGIDAHVNLIRLNPTDGYSGAATRDRAAFRFREIIQSAGLPCTIRQRRGIDVAGGCGQLTSNAPSGIIHRLCPPQ